jgi:hypothetical protein
MRHLDRKEWPYQKQCAPNKTENIEWLEEYMLGRDKDEWNWVQIGPMLVYCFKREQDYMMFLLSRT